MTNRMLNRKPMIGGKLEEAPPSAELEILRQIRVAK